MQGLYQKRAPNGKIALKRRPAGEERDLLERKRITTWLAPLIDEGPQWENRSQAEPRRGGARLTGTENDYDVTRIAS